VSRIDFVSLFGQALMGLGRPLDWEETGMMQALSIAQRSKCSRARNGCALVKENRVISHGYNGTLSGQPPCDHDNGQPCDLAVHAETNAVFWAAREGISVKGSTAFVTTSPCRLCARALHQSGVVRVVYLKEYRDPSGLDILDSVGIPHTQLAIGRQILEELA
jgi:dCMP deaminase